MRTGIQESIRIQQINDIKNTIFIRWVNGYKNAYSRAIVKCAVDGYEREMSVNGLVNGSTGCPQCSGKRRLTQSEREAQICALENIEFLRWVDNCTSRKSKAVVRCSLDGYEWTAAVGNLVNNGSGCPRCAGNQKWTVDKSIEEINKLNNIRFIGFDGEYKNMNSQANVVCLVDGTEWKTSVTKLVTSGYGCPKCAKYGFDKSRAGTLYALRSECGRFVKIGISNKPEQRLSQLKTATPFHFSVIERIAGHGSEMAKLERHFHSKYENAGLSGFHGSTEWLTFSDALYKEIVSTRSEYA